MDQISTNLLSTYLQHDSIAVYNIFPQASISQTSFKEGDTLQLKANELVALYKHCYNLEKPKEVNNLTKNLLGFISVSRAASFKTYFQSQLIVV